MEIILDKQSENSNMYEYMECVGTLEYYYKVTVPSNYDGLVLFIGEGYTQEDYETGKMMPEFGTILNFEDSSKNRYIRIEDCIK